MVLENNESWFPAISRANRALSTTRRQQESAGAAAEAQVLDVEAEEAAFEGVEVGDDAEEDEEARRRLAAVQAERLAAAQAEAAVLEGLREASSLRRGRGGVEPAEVLPEAHGSPSSSSSGDNGSLAVAAAADRKPLFEISAQQIEASSLEEAERRLEALQREVELRKAAAAAAAAAAPFEQQQ